jgi:riboflavin kinase
MAPRYRQLRPYLLCTLVELLDLGAGAGPVRVSTTELASVMGVSQQSASRHLRLLEGRGMVSRRVEAEGSLISISEEGLGVLGEVCGVLRRGLEESAGEELAFEGTVFSGMYQGAYYLSQGDYLEQIREKLGFEPYLGTLNIRIREGDLERRRSLDRMPSIRIEGFRGEAREFGGGRCYPLVVNGEVEGALVVADRTSYDLSVMEIIAPVSLRERFGLRDGDTVRVTISGPRRSSS